MVHLYGNDMIAHGGRGALFQEQKALDDDDRRIPAMNLELGLQLVEKLLPVDAVSRLPILPAARPERRRRAEVGGLLAVRRLVKHPVVVRVV